MSLCGPTRIQLLTVIGLALLAGCHGSSGSSAGNPPALDAAEVNLVFVPSEDLDHNAAGDVDPDTAVLTSQGLQRALAMGAFLRQSVLGGADATGIYALEPMTHLQTANQYPDMNALMAVQPFALLNQTTLSSDLSGGSFYTGQNAPIFASYAAGAVPGGAVAPAQFHPECQGLDFQDTLGDNEALIDTLLAGQKPGFYVFAAPWATVAGTLANLDSAHGYHLDLPAGYQGPNQIYALAITTAGAARFSTYDSGIHPPATYPALDASAFQASTPPAPSPAALTVTGGAGGAVVPATANRNETLYLVRHAEAHPHDYWSDNNILGAGQWRALGLPDALRGRISPDQVWSLDPAQSTEGTVNAAGVSQWSSVAPALTVLPYAIGNGLPYDLVADIDASAADAGQRLSDFFFTGGRFTGHKLLVGWTYTQNPQIIDALLGTYFPGGGAPAAPTWAATDYDSLWVVTLDADGNLVQRPASPVN